MGCRDMAKAASVSDSDKDNSLLMVREDSGSSVEWGRYRLCRGAVFPDDERQPSLLKPPFTACCRPLLSELEELVKFLHAHVTVSVGCGDGYIEGLLQQNGCSLVAVDLCVRGEDPFAYEDLPCYSLAGIRRLDANCLYDAKTYGVIDARPPFILPSSSVCSIDEATGSAVTLNTAFSTATATTSTLRSRSSSSTGSAACNLALLFCFGRRLPWKAYISAYGDDLKRVVIIGDIISDGITQPWCGALSDSKSWRLVQQKPINGVLGESMRCTLWERCEPR